MGINKLKVIIVGGGPIGLTAAHAFSKANIDFVILERSQQPVIDAGSNLVLLPIGLRALGQLGLRDSLNKVSSTLGVIDRQDHNGRDIGDMRLFIHAEENFGIAPIVVSRHDLTKVLYESLPTDIQDKILTDKKVTSIKSRENGVEVICADGSTHEGSIVIGADGAHSVVRDQMRAVALEAGSEDVNDEKPFLTTYRALWVRCPTSAAGIAAGVTAETHGPDAATQLFSDKETTVTGVYERLEEPTRDRVRYTEADQAALVARWGHLPLVPGGKFSLKDAFTSRVQSGLVSLEEGVVEHWSWDGRIVLAGDAAHKFTPSTGAGCNNGIIDVIVLANEMNRIVEKVRTSSGDPQASPDRAQIASAFKAYQTSRMEAVTRGCEGAGKATASATWQTGVHKFIDTWVLSSHYVQRYMTNKMAPKIAQTPVLEFVKNEEQFHGKIPWANPTQSATA
ncbi:hypothetical protein FZEAL_9446 [Fusarium zealandicum]|uniref:FAD-binding domain-containing protein n=1 Tax=Fusarium zealandicum TaxID=1053134 RepID=A0A8H4UB23_9HYPO|nr:hypothetical protein FZEAL_9446 [Fusarium zealandicum]